MSQLEFRSSNAVLTFEVVDRSLSGTAFTVAVSTPSFSGKALSGTYVVGSPAAMFRNMAYETRGWKGAKTWSDVDRQVSLAATIHVAGYVLLAVELSNHADSRLRVVFEFENGQLENMANALEELLA